LSPDAPDPVQKLLLVSDYMCHCLHIVYPARYTRWL
jgi:hypothetical protein